MARTKSPSEAKKTSQELAAAIRAGCFSSEQEAVREAVQMMFASQPQLRLEAAIRQYLTVKSLWDERLRLSELPAGDFASCSCSGVFA